MMKVQKKILIVLIFLLVSTSIMNAQTKLNPEKKVNKRVGSLINLRPEYEERYVILHKYTFPGVLDRIRESNIRNYSIFLLNGILFSYYEYVGNDYDADEKAIVDPATKDWWKLTDPMQEPLPTRKEGEWWAKMEQLLCLEKIMKPSTEAQRIGLSAEVIQGKDEELVELCKNFPEELEAESNKYGFQNANFFIKDGKVYYYYEYVGTDIGSSYNGLSRSEKFKTFQNEMNKFLVPKGNSPWEVMKEVFHTN